MSFASSVKDDLARINCTRTCCRLAEFAAFFRMCGSIHITGGNKISLTLTTEHAASARKVFTLARELFALNTEIIIHRSPRLRKNRIYEVQIPAQEGINSVFACLGLMDANEIWNENFPGDFSEQITAKECCRAAYLRGAFLGAGSISDPEAAYHLEFFTPDKNHAELLQKMLLGLELNGKITERKGGYVVYLKQVEQICELLAHIGSHRALLEIENTRVTKEMRNKITREVNCETANVDKTVKASMEQIEAIKMIDKYLGLSGLSPSLAEAAQLRIENPDSSLTELAALAGIGRSGMNHRLRRLSELAEQLQIDGEQLPKKKKQYKNKKY